VRGKVVMEDGKVDQTNIGHGNFVKISPNYQQKSK
jgi:hypothetical protein